MDHKAPEGMHWYWTMYNIAADKTQIKAGETLGEVGSNSINDLNQYAPPCSKGPVKKAILILCTRYLHRLPLIAIQR
ncbi:hypothetical protein [Pseudoalteromonas sp. LC2018020214]|uniref:hypothetical protein n=1 Tax=Pseudoalteromonas sp. LC2018020214 TaxID=2799564 RepID=UPI001F45101D|nr:hypothetical protein [Pseudoalteromonas sp. LC2018020214]